MNLLHSCVVIQHFNHLFGLFLCHCQAYLITTLQDSLGCELTQILVQILQPFLLKLRKSLSGIPSEELDELLEQDIAIFGDLEVVLEEGYNLWRIYLAQIPLHQGFRLRQGRILGHFRLLK